MLFDALTIAGYLVPLHGGYSGFWSLIQKTDSNRARGLTPEPDGFL